MECHKEYAKFKRTVFCYNGKDITDGALTMIQISYIFIPVILGILVIVCFLFMNIEEENKRLSGESK